MASEKAAIDCRFGTAKEGDEIVLPGPFVFAPSEVVGILRAIGTNDKCSHHTYDLFLFGAMIGKVQAKLEGGKTTWRVLE
jgi:hypothetical protein